MKNSTISECKMIELTKIANRSGNITAVSNNDDIPFRVRRVFYIYDIPGGENRGAHAHKECHQFLIAVSGSFDVEMDDGNKKKKITLNRPYCGLHLPPGIWAAEKSFSSGAVCLVLASHSFDESDYVRSYKSYKEIKLNLR